MNFKVSRYLANDNCTKESLLSLLETALAEFEETSQHYFKKSVKETPELHSMYVALIRDPKTDQVEVQLTMCDPPSPCTKELKALTFQEIASKGLQAMMGSSSTIPYVSYKVTW